MADKILPLISSSILAAIVYVFIFLTFKKLYTPKYEKKTIYVLALIAAVICMRLINLIGIPLLNISYTFISINVLSLILYKDSFKRMFLHNTLLTLITFFCDISTVAVWSIIKSENLINILSDTQLMIISNLLNIMMLFLAYKIYVTVIGNDELEMIHYNEIVALIVMTLFEIFVSHKFVMRVSGTSDGIDLIIILVGFLLFNIFIAGIIGKLSNEYKSKYELNLSKKQNEIQLLHYQEANSKYKESRKAVHDIKKHLSVITALQSADKERSEQYVSLIEKKVDDLFFNFKCSNEILSIVMSQKIISAEAENIKVHTEIEDLLLDFIVDIDVTAIFANLWDNAIEACRKVDTKDRYINVSMSKINGFIIINMENSYDGKLKERKNKLLSTKNNHDGVGINIVKTTVEKYNGVFGVKHTDNIFKAEITIPIPRT